MPLGMMYRAHGQIKLQNNGFGTEVLVGMKNIFFNDCNSIYKTFE